MIDNLNDLVTPPLCVLPDRGSKLPALFPLPTVFFAGDTIYDSCAEHQASRKKYFYDFKNFNYIISHFL